MTSATAINAVPVLRKPAQATPGVELAAQFDSTRKNSPSRDIARIDRLTALDSTGGAAWPFSVGRVICLVSFASTDCQIDSSLSLVVHGRSSFVESFVWFLPFLCALGKRREKRKEEREKRKENKRKTGKREEENKRKRKKRGGEEEKKRKKSSKKSQNPKTPPDELSHHDSKKKKTAGRNYLAIFFESSESHPFFN